MGLIVSYISASMGGSDRRGIAKDGQGRHAIAVSGSMIFNPTTQVLGNKQDDNVVFAANPDAAYIFSGSTHSGNTDKTLFMGDVTVSGTLRAGDGEFVNTDGTGTANELAIFLDSNTILGSSSLSYVPGGLGDGSEAQLRFNSGLVGNGVAGRKLAFLDSDMFIQASANGTLQIESDTNLDLNAGAAGDVTVDGGQVQLTAAHDVEEAVKLHADAGADQTIVIVNDEGTSESAIAITSSAGGVDINAAAGKDVTVDGGQVILTAAHNVASAIKLHADAGAAQTIQVINDESLVDGADSAGAIDIQATLGGIGIRANDAKDIWIEGGQVVATANHDTAGAIKLHADAGTAQTIQLLNDEGTASTAIDIQATAGGFSVDGVQASNITVASAGDEDDLTIAVTGATDSSLILSSTGTQADALQINASSTGGVDISAGNIINNTNSNIDIDAKNNVTIDAQGIDLNDGVTISLGTDTANTRLQLNNNTGTKKFKVDALGDVEVGRDLAVTRNATITGNLTVNGDVTAVDTTNTNIKDALIILNSGSDASPQSAHDPGLIFARPDVSRALFVDANDSEKFKFVTTYTSASATTVTKVANAAVEMGVLEADRVLSADLTATHVVYAGTSGHLKGEAGFTYTEGTDRLVAANVQGSTKVEVGGTDNHLSIEATGVDNNLLITAEKTLSGTAGEGMVLQALGTHEADLIKLRAANGFMAFGKDQDVGGILFESKAPGDGSGGSAIQIFDYQGMASGGGTNDDWFRISVSDNGSTRLESNDAGGGADANILMVADGDIELKASGSDITLSSAEKQHLNFGFGTSTLSRIMNGDGQQITFEVGEGSEEVFRITDTGTDDEAAIQMSKLNDNASSHKIEFASTARFMQYANTVATGSSGETRINSSDAHAGVVVGDSKAFHIYENHDTGSGNSILQHLAITPDESNASSQFAASGPVVSIVGGRAAADMGGGGGTVQFVLGAYDGDLARPMITMQFNSGEGDIMLGHSGMSAGSVAVTPAEDNAMDLGAPDARFRNIYTGDLHLANERGNWTLVEESNMLTFRNNLNGKWFRMVMEEIDPSGRDEGMNGAAPVGSEGNPAGDVDWEF